MLLVCVCVLCVCVHVCVRDDDGVGQVCGQYFSPQYNDSGWDELFYSNTCVMRHSGESHRMPHHTHTCTLTHTHTHTQQVGGERERERERKRDREREGESTAAAAAAGALQRSATHCALRAAVWCCAVLYCVLCCAVQDAGCGELRAEGPGDPASSVQQHGQGLCYAHSSPALPTPHLTAACPLRCIRCGASSGGVSSALLTPHPTVCMRCCCCVCCVMCAV